MSDSHAFCMNLEELGMSVIRTTRKSQHFGWAAADMARQIHLGDGCPVKTT